MEVKTDLTKSSSTHRHRRPEFIDDECSTDSGCSSGGSTGSAEHLSRRPHSDCCYLHREHGHHQRGTTRSHERLSRSSVSNGGQRGHAKKSRSWSPSETRRRTKESPCHSSSPSDAHSTDSDSLKRPPKTEILRRALQCLKLGKWENHGKEKKLTKKSPKRILREPVSYTYIRGLSGLPTQRVPRNPVHQLSSCSCRDTLTLYRKNLGCR